MGIRSKPFFRDGMIGAIALVAAAGFLGFSPARAQSHGASPALPPGQIERMISARGYRLTGPVIRHGKVYVANVLGQQDDMEQLVVDARDGRLLRRSSGGPPPRGPGGNPDEWSPLANFFGNLFGAPEDAAPLSPPPASDFFENSKPKTPAKHSKPEPKPVVQPASVPSDAKTPSPNPEAATPNIATPSVATPSPTTPSATTPSVAPPPTVAGAKAPAAPPETAAAAPPAAAPKTSTPKLNDVPVAPLE